MGERARTWASLRSLIGMPIVDVILEGGSLGSWE